MKKTLALCAIALVGMSLTTPSMAREKGDVVVRVGAAMVDPTGDPALDLGSTGKITVDSNTQLGIDLTYMLSDTLGVGVLGATPFKHDIQLSGSKIGSTRHLPPTITLQYHPKMDGRFQPYVGAGFNYTHFYNDTTILGDLELDKSTGVALELGADYALAKNMGLNAAVWKADIDSKAKLGGAPLGTVKIDPMVYMLGAYYEF